MDITDNFKSQRKTDPEELFQSLPDKTRQLLANLKNPQVLREHTQALTKELMGYDKAVQVQVFLDIGKAKGVLESEFPDYIYSYKGKSELQNHVKEQIAHTFNIDMKRDMLVHMISGITGFAEIQKSTRPKKKM